MAIKSLVVGVCGVALMCGSAWAATLQPGQGDLVINQGQGFQPVNNRIDANIGDSVMVSPGGSATVVYDDGCKVDVQPGAVTTISPLSPCASGSNAQDPDWIVPAALGVGAATAMGFGIYEATKSTSSGGTAPASP